MTKLLLILFVFSISNLFSQELILNPKSIKIETIFDYKNNSIVKFQNTEFEFELTQFQDENIYYKITSIDKIVDNEGKIYNVKNPSSSYENHSNRILIEFDSLSKTALNFSVYGKLNKLNRLEDKNKVVFKYPYDNLNKVAFQSDEDEIKIYVLDLKNLLRMKDKDRKNYDKIMDDFKVNYMFAYSQPNFSFESVKQNIEESEMDENSIVLFVSDKQNKIVKINLINSNNEVINYGYGIRDGIYTGNTWFVTLYNIHNNIRDNIYSIEVLLNKNINELPFKIEKIIIP